MKDSKEMTPLSTKISELENKGFGQELIFANGKLKDKENNTYESSDLKIVEEYRFEGESDPGSMTILYAVQNGDNKIGTVVAPYGTYSNETSEFMKDVPSETEAGNVN